MRKHDVDSGLVQFAKTATDYAKFRPGFPPSFFQELKNRGLAKPGTTALDVGTGTGTIARGLAGLGCLTKGLDPAATLLAEARAFGPATIEYVVGHAEKLPFGDKSFDLMTAGQCWHWFDQTTSAREIRRCLKPDGQLVLANFDWKPEPGNVVQQTLDLIPKHNPDFTPAKQPGFFMTTPEQIKTPEGFVNEETYTYIEKIKFSLDSWCGRIRASSAVGASMKPHKISEFEDELRALVGKMFSKKEIDIPHFVTTRIYRLN